MRISRLVACAAPVVLALSLVVPAAADTAPPPTLFVSSAAPGSQACSNAGPGTYSDPLCTVQAAANVVVPGQTVVVNVDSTITQDEIGGDIHITRSGTPDAPIVFETGGFAPRTEIRNSVFLDGGTNGFVLDGVHDVTIRGFGVKDTTSTGIVVSNSSDITLDHDNVQVYTPTSTADGIDVSGTSSNVTISRSLVDTNATNISIGPGVTGADVAENITYVYASNTYRDDVLVDGAANTDVVNNTAVFQFALCPNSVFTVMGGATGTSLENNVLLAGCTTGSPLITVDPTATATTRADYNSLYDNLNDALYSWGGVSYGTATSLAAATGQATHDTNVFASMNPWTATGPAVDSADANAPGILPTDFDGDARVDDPSTPNTGTGVGYVDRGATELQDPMGVSVSLNTKKAPTGGTVVATVKGYQGWAPITGYTVDFGDGTPPTSSSSPTISHVYAATRDAPYPITATVTDSLGNTTTDAEGYFDGVQIVPPAPLVPVLSVSHAPGINPVYYINWQNSTDSWNLESATCDFGDGSAVESVGAGVACEHFFATGPHKVTVTVTDVAGNTASGSTVVYARVVQPSAPRHHCPTCY
ncbi:MAG TPA: right-handed parallel beta-helix repeat-containing protein [Pseudonocardiaceae bacterium]|jgi:hypothetical protein|nr:right-handed parallel beta-helix repeat-containing protein [Pseudonocardiaceae bacterium]